MSDDDGNVLPEIAPHSFRRIHLVGVGGTGMGSFAGILKAAGYDVTGSDESVYSPGSPFRTRSRRASTGGSATSA